MDLLTIVIIAGAGLVALALVAYMLNRAWGDFPRRAGQLPEQPFSAPPAQTAPYAPFVAEDEEEPGFAGAPQEALIPVTNPMVLRAVNAAMDRGGSPYAAYFLRDGERVFLAAYRIADPLQREQLTRLFEGLNSGNLEGVSPMELIRIINQLGRP